MAQSGEDVKVLDGNWTEWPRAGDEGTYFALQDAATDIAIVSTSGSRAVLAAPDLVGQGYINQVSAATEEAMRAISWVRHGLVPGDRPHPLVVLRGGATFSPQAALEALGYPPGAQSFLTSESHRPENGPSGATQRYLKFEEIKGSSTLLICDIVATGGTVLSAIERALEQAPTIRHLVVVGFVTVEGATRIIERLRGRMSVLVVAFEALFRLPDPGDRARAYTTPCDFRRSRIVCDPHLVRLLAHRPDLALEQCVIYDGGERAFAPATHLQGRDRYLRYVESLSADLRREELVYRSGVLWDESRVLGEPKRVIDDLHRARDVVSEWTPASPKP